MAGMMRNTLTAVLVRGEWLQGAFETEPYEAAWAAEAVFFVRVMDVRGAASDGAAIDWKVQLSPDGIRWSGPAARPAISSGPSMCPMRE